ncbi:hypothetical protein HZM05_002802 [Salmonella enterica]|nr:hypothetical protein [Salmonella enterica]EFR0233237.1 hypothetical protein [Salmonella enterica]EHE3168814.1 hypothetical protein [Salmonella enterica]EHM5264025.1 hypothetical protein [Salmonella enterica]EKA1638919.1 hypothetical protein [Salmonella enterica]
MTTQIEVMTVAELHTQLQQLVDDGFGDIPVCATDLRARYPFQAYTVLNPAGYTDALLINVRPDAHFTRKEPLPVNWGNNRVADWNTNADAVRQACGTFADTPHSKQTTGDNLCCRQK